MWSDSACELPRLLLLPGDAECFLSPDLQGPWEETWVDFRRFYACISLDFICACLYSLILQEVNQRKHAVGNSGPAKAAFVRRSRGLVVSPRSVASWSENFSSLDASRVGKT